MDLFPKFADLCSPPGSRIERAAVVLDVRGGEALSQLPGLYHNLHRDGLKLSLVFLEASDRALIRRFEETRRPHPIGRDLPVREGIRLERILLKPMRDLADAVIDTTRMNVHELRDSVQMRFGGLAGRKSVLLSVVSFGFRFGVPTDADLVFDVRFLPNPNFIPHLKPFTGADAAVVDYMNSHEATGTFLKHVDNLLEFLLPQYEKEGKSYVTVGIGCTGGRHRSVMIANELAGRLRHAGFDAQAAHRDVRKFKRKKPEARARTAQRVRQV